MRQTGLLRSVLLGSALLAAGCSRPQPEGQVLATIDGDGVTMRDLAAEGQDGSGKAALAQVVERRLLANAARDMGLERDPEYLAQMRRAREQLLVQALGRELQGRIAAPTTAEVARFISENPHAFGQRRIVALSSPDGENSFEMDTARVPPEQAARLAELTPGETYSIPGALSYRVAAVRPAPLTGDAAAVFASQSLMAARLTAALQAELAARQGKATILYKKGIGNSGR